MKAFAWTLVAISLLAAGPAHATGAFAVDSSTGQRAGDEGYGIGWGDTKNEASKAALKLCRNAGNDGCKVVAWFETCGAYASNRTTYGVGWGATQEDAEAMALEKCGRCKIVLSECE